MKKSIRDFIEIMTLVLALYYAKDIIDYYPIFRQNLADGVITFEGVAFFLLVVVLIYFVIRSLKLLLKK
uniref:hypothetical protein n=1 Tax=Ornithobacterium rhinotracheale TaxID=28251 RepID=UPI0039A6E08A